MYLCPESLILWAFRAFSVFRGLGGTSRHQPASYCGDHIVPWRLIFAHPCPARICQKRGNAKKYPLPDSTTSFNENNLAGTSRLPLFFLFPLESLSAISADYIDLPRCPDINTNPMKTSPIRIISSTIIFGGSNWAENGTAFTTRTAAVMSS